MMVDFIEILIIFMSDENLFQEFIDKVKVQHTRYLFYKIQVNNNF